MTDLINGTGNACAWHKRPKLCSEALINAELTESDENAGALDPTGSDNI